MTNELIDRLTSRKFLLTIAAIAYVIVQVAGGAVSTAEGVDTIWKLIAAYIAAEGLADTAGRLKPDVPTDPAPTPPDVV